MSVLWEMSNKVQVIIHANFNLERDSKDIVVSRVSYSALVNSVQAVFPMGRDLVIKSKDRHLIIDNEDAWKLLMDNTELVAMFKSRSIKTTVIVELSAVFGYAEVKKTIEVEHSSFRELVKKVRNSFSIGRALHMEIEDTRILLLSNHGADTYFRLKTSDRLVAVFASREIEFNVKCIGVFHGNTTVALKDSLKFTGFDYGCVVDAVENEFQDGIINDMYDDESQSIVYESSFLMLQHGTKLCVKLTFDSVFDLSKDHPGSFFDTADAFRQRVLTFGSLYYTNRPELMRV